MGAIRYRGRSFVDIFNDTYMHAEKRRTTIMILRRRLFFERMLNIKDVAKRAKNSVVVLLRSRAVCCGMCSIVGSAKGSANGMVSHVHGRMMGVSISAGSPMDFSCRDEMHNAPEIGTNLFARPKPKNTSPIQIASGPMSCVIIISGAYRMMLGMMLYRIENHCSASSDTPKPVIIYPI